MDEETGFRSLFIGARDGLRLHARDYGPLASHALPVVCLPGFARTAAVRSCIMSSSSTT